MDSRNVKQNSVLVVDDDEALTRSIATLLRLDGFEVSSACDGISGYTSYFGNPTQSVVTDIQMPQWDGIKMVRSIRTLNPNVKVVYVSGAVGRYRTEIEKKEEIAGAVFLEKPFTRKDLLEILAPQVAAPRTEPQHLADSVARIQEPAPAASVIVRAPRWETHYN